MKYEIASVYHAKKIIGQFKFFNAFEYMLFLLPQMVFRKFKPDFVL